MTNPSPTPRSAVWSIPVGAFAISSAFTAVGYRFSGATLGMFIAGLVATAIVVPALAAGEKRGPVQLLAGAGGLLGVAGVWLLVILRHRNDAMGENALPLTLHQWLSCTALLASWCAALVGLTALILRLKCHPIVAFTKIAMLAVLWLSFPFWVSSFAHGASSEAVVQGLIDAHPPFAIDGVLLDSTQAPWREHRLLYSQTNLGDEIPFALPESIRTAALVNVVLAAVGFGVAQIRPGQPQGAQP